jgi:hypothetical protein
MPEPKDIVLGILGASVALAGLLLVFCAFLLTKADSFPTDTDDKIINKYLMAGKLGLIPFLWSLAVAGISTAWVLCPSGRLFWMTNAGFILLLLGTAVYGALTILRFG